MVLITLMSAMPIVSAQSKEGNAYYARQNSFGIFGAYSGDSSHMLLGTTENRKLLDFGVAYGHKLVLNRIVNWQYNGELLPIALESDPEGLETIDWTSPGVYTESATFVPVGPCIPSSGTYSITINGKSYSYTNTVTCSRRWTIGEGISPVGFQWNFIPRHKLQPFFIGHGGYMYSTRPIPAPEAGSFNFTFDFGAGFELYRSRTKSIRTEYRFHHISNHNTAQANPGIDSGLFQVTYAFGR
jgi:hypothetical protein